MPLKVLIPKQLAADPRRMARAIENALTGAARAAKADFETTTATWEHQPAFDIQVSAPGERVIGTDDRIYSYLDQGTRPHDIAPRKPGGLLRFSASGFRPKTRPGYIGSNKGATGSSGPVFTRRVRHPGITARGFATAIQKKWQRELPVTFQRAIDSEVAS